MRIGIVGVPYPTGGGVLTKAVAKFLATTAHEVRCFDNYYLGPHTPFQKRVSQRMPCRATRAIGST